MKNLILILIAGLFLTGCFSPINSVYDTAKLLEVGEIQVKGNYSVYSTIVQVTNVNVGASAAVGIHDKVNLGLRYEQLHGTDYNISDSQFNEKINYNYFEARAKFKLYKDNVAFETPISLYTHEGNPLTFSFEPRLYFTYRANKYLDFTNVMKINYLKNIEDDRLFLGAERIFPGVIFGIGLSSDLDDWAIRPEVGYDGNFTCGVGFSYNFKL